MESTHSNDFFFHVSRKLLVLTTHNPQILYSLWQNANARRSSLNIFFSGNVTLTNLLDTQLSCPHPRGTTVSLKTKPLGWKLLSLKPSSGKHAPTSPTFLDCNYSMLSIWETIYIAVQKCNDSSHCLSHFTLVHLFLIIPSIFSEEKWKRTWLQGSENFYFSKYQMRECCLTDFNFSLFLSTIQCHATSRLVLIWEATARSKNNFNHWE